MDEKQAAALRKAFDKKAIGQLPKGGTMLDYVGHAVTTDRLLTVDPEWTWEPMALDQYGSPQCDREGNLWIRLTICGVTRLGCGDGPTMKVRIGDAIRNAAMRFGVALDLWTKEELEGEPSETRAPEKKAERVKETPPDDPWYDGPPKPDESRQVSKEQLGMIGALMGRQGLTIREDALAYVADVIGRQITSRNDLTRAEASRVIGALQADQPQGETV